MIWSDKSTVKKGDIGESIVDEYLRKKGFIPYAPAFDGAHPFDRLCASPDKKRIFIAETKSKPARVCYPDTGIDERHYKDYMHIYAKYFIKVYMFFVDEVAKKIYGGWLDKLDLPRQVEHKGKILLYPIVTNNIRYFPLEAMSDIAVISEDHSNNLKQHSNINPAYTRG